MRRIFAVLLFCIAVSPLFHQPARAQSVVSVTDWAVDYHFGQQVSVRALLSAPAPITDVSILFRAQGETSTRSDHVILDPDGHVHYIYTFTQGPLRTFARVDLWFHVTLQTGEQVDTSSFSFYYNDDRFPWQTVEDGNIRIHWYAGDEAFARQALDAARGGLQKTGALLTVTPTHPLDIYIYAVAANLQTALEIGGESWSGGHASPDLGVALVTIAPGLDQSVEIERKVPHELAHLLTYEVAGPQYEALPVWLREGIASMAETPNPDYPGAISLAVEQQTLIPLADLCNTFPPELSRVTLAYAESESFTQFIVSQYGNSGLLRLIHVYMDGVGCDQGPAQAFGSPLTGLESQWWRSAPAGANNAGALVESLLPYLGVLAVMLLIPLISVAVLWRSLNGNHKQPANK